MKKYKLKDSVKENIWFGFLIIVSTIALICIFNFNSKRIEKIENGTMILVDHNAGDR